MSQESINVDLIIKTAESAKNLGELKKSMSEVRQALDKVDVGSKSFIKLNEALDDGAEKIRNFRRGFDTLKAFDAFGRTIASSFGVASGVIAQFADDNENLQKQLLKVQAALTIVQSFSGLAEAIKAAKIANDALNASLLTNPYVLVAAGIALAVTALISFGNATEDAKKKTDEFNKTLDDNTKFIISNYEERIQKLEEEKAALDDNIKIREKDLQIDKLRLEGLKKALEQLQVNNATAEQGNQFDEKFLENKKKLQEEIGKLESSIAIKTIQYNKENTKEIKAQNEELKNKTAELKKQNQLEQEKNQFLIDYLSNYKLLVSESEKYNSVIIALGASQELIRQDSYDYLIKEKEALEDAEELLTKQIANEKTSNELLEFRRKQLLEIRTELSKISNKIEIEEIKINKKAYTNIFGSDSNAAQSLLSAEFQKLLDPLIKKVGEEFQNVIEDDNSWVVTARAKKQLEELQKLLLEYQKEQDIISGNIQATSLNVERFFEVVNLGEQESIYGLTDFSDAFQTNVIDQVNVLRESISNRIFKKEIDDLFNALGGKELNAESLTAFIGIIKNVYTTYKNSISGIKRDLDNLFTSGKISYEEYTQSIEQLTANSLGSLDELNARILSTIDTIKDPEIKDSVLKYFQAISKGAETANGSLTKLAKTQQEVNEESIKKTAQTINTNIGYFEQKYNELTDILQTAADQRIKILEDERTRATQILDEQLAKRLISEQQYRDKLDALNQEYKLKEREERKDAFKKEKISKTISAVINTALAVTSALTVAPPAGYVLAAISAALGAAQVGLIAAQPTPEFATGGFVSGPGGPKDDAINAKLSNGEYVVNARSTSAFKPLLDQINYMPNLGQKVGVESGVQTNTTTTKRTEENKLKVYVLQNDISQANKRASDIKTRVTF